MSRLLYQLSYRPISALPFSKIMIEMERKTRLELATPTLARWCSTTELFPHYYQLQVMHSSCLAELTKHILTPWHNFVNTFLFFFFGLQFSLPQPETARQTKRHRECFRLLHSASFFYLELIIGFEPTTCSLRMSCSTN